MQVQTVAIPPTAPPGGGSGTPINSPDDIVETLDEALSRAEARQEQLALVHMTNSGVGEMHAAMFADGPRAARKYPPYRVVEFSVVFPIDQILQAAHPMDPRVPPLTREQIRANMLRSVGEWEAQARARQGNGTWFLWTVIRVAQATSKSAEQLPAGGRTTMDGISAQRVFGTGSGAEMMDQEPTVDTVRLIQKPAIEYRLLYIDVSGRSTETLDGKAVQRGPATDGNASIDRLANLLSTALGKPADPPAPVAPRAVVTVVEPTVNLPSAESVRAASSTEPKVDRFPGVPIKGADGKTIPFLSRKAMWEKMQKEAAKSGGVRVVEPDAEGGA